MTKRLEEIERLWSRHPALWTGLNVVFYALSTLALLVLFFGR